MSSVYPFDSQSGHGGGRGTNRCASRLTQGCGSEVVFCDGFAVGDDKFRKVDAAERVESSHLKSVRY